MDNFNYLLKDEFEVLFFITETLFVELWIEGSALAVVVSDGRTQRVVQRTVQIISALKIRTVFKEFAFIN
jgi:hypothetical protein